MVKCLKFEVCRQFCRELDLFCSFVLQFCSAAGSSSSDVMDLVLEQVTDLTAFPWTSPMKEKSHSR